MSTLDTFRASLNSPRALLAAYERYGVWLPKAATVVLTIVLARIAAQLVWVLVPAAPTGWQPPPAPPVASAAKDSDLTTIAAAHLFGQYQAPRADAVDVRKLKQSTLNLNLLGVFAWTPKLSRAIIQPQGGEAKPFAIGDTIVSGVTLNSVLPDRVILSRNGKLEALLLNRENSGDGGNDVASNDDNGDADAPPYGEDAADAEDAASSVAEVRNQLLSDPSRAAEYIRVMPLNAGGGLNGYRIYPGPDRTLFTGTGLRPGDVVTAVNGIQLNDPARALQMLGDLAHTNDLNITVNRGGTNQTIRVNLNQ
jgi:general secretion pathway protein C